MSNLPFEHKIPRRMGIRARPFPSFHTVSPARHLQCIPSYLNISHFKPYCHFEVPPQLCVSEVSLEKLKGKNTSSYRKC